MKILNFLKIFVSPLRMARHRSMSLLISICIFALFGGNIISIPSTVYYKNHIYEYIDTSDDKSILDFHVLLDIPESDTTIQDFFSEWHCLITDNTLSCDVYNEHPMSVITYSKENSKGEDITYNIKIIIDSLPEIEGEVTKFPISDAFEDLPAEHQNYLLVFYENKLLYKIPNSTSVGTVRSNTTFEFTYQRAKGDGLFSIGAMGENSNTAGVYLSRRLAETVYYDLLKLNLTFMGFIYCFFWPLLLTFILWILFKKSGKMDTYKEFYNIAALSAIVPIILIFGITWFFPMALDLFIPIYSFYTMFMIYKINNSTTVSNDNHMLISP